MACHGASCCACASLKLALVTMVAIIFHTALNNVTANSASTYRTTAIIIIIVVTRFNNSWFILCFCSITMMLPSRWWRWRQRWLWLRHC